MTLGCGARAVLGFIGLLALLPTVGCRERRAGEVRETAVAGSAAVVRAPDSLPPDPCPLIGAWQPCKVERRLKESGLVPVRDSAPASRPLAGVADDVYTLGPAELHVWIFPDSLARAGALAGLDTATGMPKSSLARWDRHPTVIAESNLLAILLAENERLIERVQLALTAGMPPR